MIDAIVKGLRDLADVVEKEGPKFVASFGTGFGLDDLVKEKPKTDSNDRMSKVRNAMKSEISLAYGLSDGVMDGTNDDILVKWWKSAVRMNGDTNIDDDDVIFFTTKIV